MNQSDVVVKRFDRFYFDVERRAADAIRGVSKENCNLHA